MFKVGDKIGAIEKGRALEEATITRIDDEYYYCSIIRGTARIPRSAEGFYELKK